jgi:hypothetical protein
MDSLLVKPVAEATKAIDQFASMQETSQISRWVASQGLLLPLRLAADERHELCHTLAS